MSDSKRILQITLPSIHWRDLFSRRNFLFLLAFLGCFWGVYWWRTIRPYESLQGAVLQMKTREIFAESTGRLSEISLDEGDFFSKGQPLFSFADSLLSSQLHALRQEIQQEKTKLNQNMQQYLYLQNELELETGPTELTHQILDEVQQQQERITAMEWDLSNLESNLHQKVVSAPFEGMILQKFKQTGEKTSVGDPLLLVCEKDKRWVEASVSETLLGKIQLGTSANIQFDSFPGKVWTGKISWISPVASGGKIKIRMIAENLPLNPGLSAKAAIKIHS